MEKALIIFAKKPEPGKVKTRLAKDLGEEEACKVYKQLLFYTFDMAEACNAFVVASFNKKDEHTLEAIPYSSYHQQIEGDLGEKLKEAIYDTFNRGFKKVLCIGSDCADLTPEIIQEAYKRLDQHDVVIGPAEDGGYYLIGTKKPTNYLFEDKTWSSQVLIEETLASIKEQNESVALLEKLSDIDTIEDLKRTKNKLIRWHHHI